VIHCTVWYFSFLLSTPRGDGGPAQAGPPSSPQKHQKKYLKKLITSLLSINIPPLG